MPERSDRPSIPALERAAKFLMAHPEWTRFREYIWNPACDCRACSWGCSSYKMYLANPKRRPGVANPATQDEQDPS